MPRHEEEYKGKKIVVEEDDNQIAVAVDGKAIPVTRDDQYRRYLTTLLPYFSFVSPMDLAREVIDHVPQSSQQTSDAA